jgi:hypothetical protein
MWVCLRFSSLAGSSFESDGCSSGGRGSVFGSTPLPVLILLPPVALDVPPVPVKPLAVSGKG